MKIKLKFFLGVFVAIALNTFVQNIFANICPSYVCKRSGGAPSCSPFPCASDGGLTCPPIYVYNKSGDAYNLKWEVGVTDSKTHQLFSTIGKAKIKPSQDKIQSIGKFYWYAPKHVKNPRDRVVDYVMLRLTPEGEQPALEEKQFLNKKRLHQSRYFIAKEKIYPLSQAKKDRLLNICLFIDKNKQAEMRVGKGKRCISK